MNRNTRHTADQHAADASEKLRYVFCLRCRCPNCDSPRLKTLRSAPCEEDGERSQRKLCEDCGHRFFCVWT